MSRTPQIDRACKYIPEPRESDGLPPGRWVARRGIQVFEPDQLALDLRDTPDIAAMVVEQDVWDTIAFNLIATPPPVPPPAVTGELCDDCGCLLKPAERCPRCLLWALKDEQQWEQQRDRWSRRHVIWDVLNQRKVAA